MRWRRAGGSLVLAAATAAGVGSPAAGQWPAGRGEYWVKASLFHHETRTQYAFDGSTRPFFQPNAESRSNAFFLDVLYGITDRLDVWAQVPWFDLRFDDDTQSLHDSGIGDIRLSLRYNLLRLRGGSVPVSARITAKVPVVDFEIDRDVIPVGDGQWDYEAWLETGVSLWPLPAYGVLWLGYRWRTLNESTTVDPGDERVLLAEAGGTLAGRLGGKVVLDASFGKPTAIQGVSSPNDRREIVYVQPTLTFDLTPALTLEVGPRLPLHGKNFPAGRQWVLGLFHRAPS